MSVLEQVEAIWPDVVRDVRPRNRALEAVLRDIHPLDVDVEGATVVLQATSLFHKTNIEKRASRKMIEELLEKHLGAPYRIACTVEERQEKPDVRSRIRAARKDPRVRAAINIFDADIVDIEDEPDESDGS